ncbi:MAG: DNA translocase FtsK [Bacteroidetes bacterium]|nr:DNA translocase FtsK [Bacteroidota bacterium]
MEIIKNQLKKNTLKENKKEEIIAPLPDIPPKKTVQKKETKKTISSKKTNVTKKYFFNDERFHKVVGLFFILFSIYLLFAFISYIFSWEIDDDIFTKTDFIIDPKIVSVNWMGKMGAFLSYIFIKKSFGVASIIFVFLLFISGLKLFSNTKTFPLAITFQYSFFGLIWTSLALGYLLNTPEYLIYGGIFGFQSNTWLTGVLGTIGAGMILLFSFISFLIIVYNISFKWYKKKISAENIDVNNNIDIPESENDATNALSKNTISKNEENKDNTDIPDEIINTNTVEFDVKKSIINVPEKNKEIEKKNVLVTDPVKKDSDKVEFTVENKVAENKIIENINSEENDLAMNLVKELGSYDPTLDLRDYKLPSLDLLDDYDSNSVGVQKEELEANKNRIVETLNNYSIQIEKIKATIGPTVTLYEIVPAPGVRISRIKNLEDDIALSLSALGIRIIAPIPGKGTIGIEVPNQRPEIVSMKSILSSDKFTNNNFELPIGLGKTISNESFVADLTKMPHLLVAGATGQGKSVGLNAILTSLLYKKHPSQIKFILVDPKKVELTLFSKIERHYLAKLPDLEEAIITDTKQVVRTLNSLCIEMDQRYDLLRDAKVRNIKEYNEKFISRKLNPNEGHRFLPYIVLIVDEFADLIILSGREIETPITRLAQLSRAIGIHLIIATQRPSVNIITGTIKANFPARLAFRVISKIDSRTILDTGGADQLIGRGDMLLSTGSDLIRIQCAFVDIHEVERITEFIGGQRGYPDAFHLPEFNDESNDEGKNIDASDRDDFFEEAARIIVTHQQGSTSLLQRKLKLGYNRAGRIIDQLEAIGIIGPFEGSKAREVKIKDLDHLEQFLKIYRDPLKTNL